MPVYEYKCENCGYQFEELQKINDKPLTRCPKCQGKLKKLFSTTNFKFKSGSPTKDEPKRFSEIDKPLPL